MQYSLSNRLSSNVSGIDPDAKAYIAAVEAVLPGNNIATALPNASNPKRIISDFIKAEKAASRWSLHKRIYLPIYNNAAASAVDMVSWTSGTFQGLSGSVTHAPGYVQGNGTSGYFDIGQSPTGLGVSLDSQSYSFLSYSVDLTGTRAVISSYQNTTTQGDIYSTDTQVLVNFNTLVVGNLARLSQTGIFTGARSGGKTSIYRRSQSGHSILADFTFAATGSLSTANINVMRSLFNGGSAYSNRQLGSFAIHSGLSLANNQGFSANLKTLWESLTGLTLP